MKAAAPRHRSCQVRSSTPSGRQIWSFQLTKTALTPAGETTLPASAPAPKITASQDWKALVQPQLNIAWLPADAVFIRAIQLPSGEPSELPAMVEFQLEKLSPLPLNQIVWTALGVPHPDGAQQTAVVTVASRTAVEEFLDAEVASGFTPDRLDLPLLRWWGQLRPEGSGIWILLEDAGDPAQGHSQGLAGWFMDGVWRELGLVRIPAGPEAAAVLLQQLGQSAWAGEMEGWMTSIPPVHLAATPGQHEILDGPLGEWSGHPVVPVSRPEANRLATASAEALRAEPASSLIPTEWATAQRQKFIDRLWMHGLGGLGMAYVVFLFGFLGLLNFRKYQVDDLRSEVSGMGINYTNTLQLKAQVAVLEEQVALRYAALEAWQAVVKNLPSNLTLTQLDFQKGRTLQLSGTVETESISAVTQFNSDLIKSQLDNQPLFARVKPAQINSKPGNTLANWSFDAELRRSDTP